MSSLTSPASSRNASPGPQIRMRTNRVALRQYYGLKESTDGALKQTPSLQSDDENGVTSSELDSDSFDPEAYVRKILDTKHLDEMLKIENRLISEIRSLDGEKKALVYDNYSKLIAATDTIRKMRDNMVPLTQEDSALNEDVARIAGLAGDLAMISARQSDSLTENTSVQQSLDERATKIAQVNTVKWVLDAPTRLKSMVEHGQQQEAEKDWDEVQTLLHSWKGVKGVDQVREDCSKLMQEA